MSKLSLLRQLLQSSNIDLIIVGTEDAHQSEYVSERDLRRAFISEFTGSAGTAVITHTQALLWTDGRYFLQAEKELSSEWKLMKSLEKGVPDIYDWILDNTQPGQTVGVDAWLFSTAAAKSLEKRLNEKNIQLKAFEGENPIDIVWEKHFQRPSIAINPVEVVPVERTGLSHQDKINNLRSQLSDNHCYGISITMLDEIAWLLNVRGGDVAYNPVVISYVIVTMDAVFWFVDERKVSQQVKEQLGKDVTLLPYENVEEKLREVSQKGKIWIDVGRTNWRLYKTITNESHKLEKASPLTLPKAIKTKEELSCFIESHIRDGVALTAFIHYLERTVQENPHCLTEYEATLKLEEFRSKMPLHSGPSFPTIAGYGPNGAIIHYDPSHSEGKDSRTIGVDSLFLLDSGAQYKDGTTDVTRTMHFGKATQRMKDCYTAVLKVSSFMLSCHYSFLTCSIVFLFYFFLC
jgi:Xaa-Pro aminopeptidase